MCAVKWGLFLFLFLFFCAKMPFSDKNFFDLTPQKITHHKWRGKPLYAIGDAAILKQRLTGFLCSRTFPAKVVLPIYDWAKAVRAKGETVIGGFHATLERDVYKILTNPDLSTAPVVWVLSRSLPKRLLSAEKSAIIAGRLLIISPMSQDKHRRTDATAKIRNQCVIALAEKTVIGHAGEGSKLAALLTPTCHPLPLP